MMRLIVFILSGDDSDVPPLQFCAPVAPRHTGPAFRPEDDEEDIS